MSMPQWRRKKGPINRMKKKKNNGSESMNRNECADPDPGAKDEEGSGTRWCSRLSILDK